MPTVRVLLRHSIVVANPERIVIDHTPLFTIRFGTSVPESKRESYMFWNFRSQIEKRNLVGQNELSLATAQFFTITSASKPKSGS